MYRNYESTHALQMMIEEQKKVLAAMYEADADFDEIADAKETLDLLLDRLRFAWDDEEFNERG